MVVSAAISENRAELEKLAVAKIKDRLEGRPVRKVIVAPGNLVNVEV